MDGVWYRKMNYERAIYIFRNITLDAASTEEIGMFNNYINELIDRMNDETISLQEQNLLDLYINHLRDTVSFIDIVDKYDGVVFKKNSLNITEEQVSREVGKKKVLELTTNSHGIVTTSIILEVVIFLGIVASILILALT